MRGSGLKGGEHLGGEMLPSGKWGHPWGRELLVTDTVAS